MAVLKNYIELVDGVSGPLKAIQTNANRATASLNAVSPAMNKIGNSSGYINKAVNALSNLVAKAKRAAGLIPEIAIGNLIGDNLTSMLNGLMAIPGQLVNVAGGYAGIQARLKLLTDSQAEVNKMNELIYSSAIRSRGSYEAMADSIAKIGMTAKEAFPNVEDVVPFVEGIQKLFIIGGTDKVNQSNAMLQLTQALGAGKLQGDEFRSIAEAAPLIEQMVARYMGVTQGALKELSSEGKITAEVLKNAILQNIDEINRQFEIMPMTFDQHMQRLETIAYKAFVPVLEAINNLIASSGFNAFMDSIATGIAFMANATAMAINGLNAIFSWLGNNLLWVKNSILGVSTTFRDILYPAISFVAGFLAVWVGLWALANVVQGANAVVSYALGVAHTVASTGTTLWAMATSWLSAAITICTGGIGLFLGVVIGIPALIATVVGGFLAWRVATHGLRDTFVSAFGAIGDIVDSVVVNIVSAVNTIIDACNGAVSAINNVFGTKIGVVANVSVADFGGNSRGARLRQWASNVADGIGGMFSVPKITPSSSLGYAQGLQNENMSTLGQIADNTGKTAGNTDKMADSLDLMEEEIKSMRDYATLEQISRYTSARVSIDLGGINQNISGNTDVDGVIDRLVERLQEGMSAGAEAVFY